MRIEYNAIFLREARETMRADVRKDPWSFGFVTVATVSLAVLYLLSSRGLYHVSFPTLGFVLLCLIQPLFSHRFTNPAGVLAKERVQNTYESLIISPLTPGSFLLGQVMHYVLSVLRRTLPILPFFAVLYMLGGFTFSRFLVFQVSLLMYTIYYTTSLFAWMELYTTNEILMSQVRRMFMGRNNMNMAGNPAYIFSLMSVALVGIVLISPANSFLAQLFASSKGIPLPADYSWIRLGALIHPGLLLVLWGDIPMFGYPVPAWIMVNICWVVLSISEWYAFKYMFTYRRFRYNTGLRIMRYAVFGFFLLMISGVFWTTPNIALVISILVASGMLMIRFVLPRNMPTTDQEKWLILPGRNIFVQSAGTVFPYLLVYALLLCIVHYLLVSRSTAPDVGTVVTFMDIMILLTAVSIVLLNQVLQMREYGKRNELPTDEEEQFASGKTPPRPTVKVSPILIGAIILWFIPMPFALAELASRGTAFHPPLEMIWNLVQPLLLMNPWYAGFVLFDSNAFAITNVNLPFSALSNIRIPLVGDINYFEPAAFVMTIITVISLALYSSKRRDPALVTGVRSGRKTKTP